MTVFLGCPTHDGRIESDTATALRHATAGKHSIVQMVNRSSLLAYNCNQLWCMALNAREQHKIKWFAMLHSDVVPENNWLDKLIDIAEKNNADLLSAIVPIKDERGMVSTALLNHHNPFEHKVLYTPLPETEILEIGEFKLVVNTGCMICRLDQPWSDKVWFEINDKIYLEKGEWKAAVEPEDWFFSRKVHELGGKVMATRAIDLVHVGRKDYKL